MLRCLIAVLFGFSLGVVAFSAPGAVVEHLDPAGPQELPPGVAAPTERAAPPSDDRASVPGRNSASMGEEARDPSGLEAAVILIAQHTPPLVP